MSLRANEGGPPWGSEGAPVAEEPKGPNTRLIVLGAAVAVVAVLLVLTLTGAISVPFFGNKSVPLADSAFGWSLTVPRKWVAKSQVGTTNIIRFQSEGNGVGVRVQAQLFPQEVPADQIHGDVVLNQLKKLIATNRPDVTINEGPTFGTINGVPYVRYVFTFTDFSSGVAIPLKDMDYYFFNGAKLEEVTLEVSAAKYAQTAAEFNKTILTFHSRRITASPSAPTGTATSSP